MLNLSIPLYEGDGYLRLPQEARVSATAGSTPGSSDGVGRWSVERHAASLRAVIIGRAIGRAFAWLEEKYQRARWREIDSYLSRSTDHADLERRLKELERGNRFEFC